MNDLANRLRCKYPVGPIINGEPEFGWRDMSGPIETILPTSLMLEAAARIEQLEATIDDERQNPWKGALINELVVAHILTAEHVANPRKALEDAIEWNCQVALDPKVSRPARDLQQAAYERVASEVLDSAARAAADNNDLRGYQLLRGLAEATRKLGES